MKLIVHISPNQVQTPELSPHSIVIEAYPDDSILVIKTLIGLKDKILIDGMVLMLHTKNCKTLSEALTTMEDEKTLQDYNITGNDDIDCHICRTDLEFVGAITFTDGQVTKVDGFL